MRARCPVQHGVWPWNSCGRFIITAVEFLRAVITGVPPRTDTQSSPSSARHAAQLLNERPKWRRWWKGTLLLLILFRRRRQLCPPESLQLIKDSLYIYCTLTITVVTVPLHLLLSTRSSRSNTIKRNIVVEVNREKARHLKFQLESSHVIPIPALDMGRPWYIFKKLRHYIFNLSVVLACCGRSTLKIVIRVWVSVIICCVFLLLLP